MNRAHDLAERDTRFVGRDTARPIAACQALLARGTHAQGIRAPTVRDETARLPLAAAHRPFHVKRALDALHRDDLLLASTMNRTHDLAEGDKRLILRGSARAIAACQALLARGTYPPSIRPPIVREGMVRLDRRTSSAPRRARTRRARPRRHPSCEVTMSRTHDLAERDNRFVGRDTVRAMAACETLLARGIYAPGIRPPTVREEPARLPLAAAHRPFPVERALDALHPDDLLPARSP